MTTTEFLLAVIAFLLFWILIIYIRNSSKNMKPKEQQKQKVHTGSRFIIDEEHDVVIDTVTGKSMNIFQYNNLLASTKEVGVGEEEDMEDID